MVWRSLLPRDGRNPGIATEEWCATLAINATANGGSNSGLGKQVVFVTNNSTKSRADYRKKLEGLGIPSNVVSSDQTGATSRPTATNPNTGRDIFLVIQLLDIHLPHSETP